VQKPQYDARRRPTKFRKGDKVLLSTRHLAGYESKLAPKWEGPFHVSQWDEKRDKYLLQLPHKFRRLHPWFHVSKLRKYVEPLETTPDVPEPPVGDDEPEYEVEAIVDHRFRQRRKEFRVRWK